MIDRGRTYAISKKMDGLQTMKEFFAMLGITEELLAQTYPINLRIFITFVVFFSVFFGTLLYMVYDAKSFLEFVQCSYYCSASIMGILDLMVVVFRANMLFTFIANSQQVIDVSKCANFETNTTKLLKTANRIRRRLIEKRIFNISIDILPGTDRNHWRKQSADGKVKWNHVFYTYENRSQRYDTMDYSYLLHLLYHWFGKRFIRITRISNVVSSEMSEIIQFIQLKLKNFI